MLHMFKHDTIHAGKAPDDAAMIWTSCSSSSGIRVASGSSPTSVVCPFFARFFLPDRVFVGSGTQLCFLCSGRSLRGFLTMTSHSFSATLHNMKTGNLFMHTRCLKEGAPLWKSLCRLLYASTCAQMSTSWIVCMLPYSSRANRN